MLDFIIVYVTVSSSAEGKRLGRCLVEERLAACVNRIGSVHSVYRWQGQVEESDEELLIIKTRRDLFDRVKRRVQELHSYAVPEIIALPILEGNESYLKWLDEQLLKSRE